jgi:hypothetical protein
MSPNVLIALKDVWNFAGTTFNRRTLTPWLHFTCPESYCVYELGGQVPVYSLHRQRVLADGTPIYVGRVLDDKARRENKADEVLEYADPEAFFKKIDERVAADTFKVQLSVTEHREFLQALRNVLPEGAVDDYACRSTHANYAVRPLVGRTLKSLTAAEAATLPDGLDLYCLRNEKGRWWKTLYDPEQPVTLAALQADPHEGSKRISGHRIELAPRLRSTYF